MTTPRDDDPLSVVDAPNKGGRPRKLEPTPETLKLVRGCGRLHCTTKECAGFFSVTETTYLKFVKDYPEVAEEFAAGMAEGKMSLRRSQFKLAEKNAAMAIFLGKQHLGQIDSYRRELTGREGRPIETVDLSKLTDQELEAYERLALKLGDDPIPTGEPGGDPGGEAPEGGGTEPI